MNVLRALLIGTTLALLSGWAMCAAPASRELTFDIPAQRLSDALNAFGRQAGLSVAFYDDTVANRTTEAVSGKFKAEAVLEMLLRNSGLNYRFVNERTIAVWGERKAEVGGLGERSQEGAGKNELRLVQGDTSSSGSSSSSSAQPGQDDHDNSPADDNSQGVKLEEIVVTAQKRVERLQNVPVAVSLVNAQTLVRSNQLRLQDYYDKIPGLNFTSRNQSGVVLSIRGIQAGAIGGPTVGVLIDDVPLGGGQVVPDIDPGELARIEVLRGPQGTLYGASSMGGLLKFVTLDPSTDGWSGRVQAGTRGVSNGTELGYNFRGAMNVPLSETLAVRASAFTRREPGYVDDPGRGLESVNRADAHGGHFSALWKPSDTLSLKVSALFQKIEADGSQQVAILPGLGDLQQRNTLQDAGAYERSVQAYSATLNSKLGGADLTLVSGYNVNKAHDVLDIGYSLSSTAQALFQVSGVASITASKNETFTQEIRLSVPLGPRVEWLLGGFYSHERTAFTQSVPAVDPATNAVAGSFLLNVPLRPGVNEEYAPFTTFTFQITDRFDIQAGARESWIKQSGRGASSSGILSANPAAATISAPTSASQKAFTYLLTPRFKVSEDLMVYARLASGYRPGGGASPQPGDLCVVNHFPCQFDPDKTKNYEIGAKGSALQDMLSFNAAVFYIDWSGIQAQLSTAGVPVFNYIANAGKAKSEGAELSVELRPLAGLILAASAAYTAAVLAEDLPPTANLFAKEGDRLPFSSRFAGSFSVDQEFPLTSTVTGIAGASVSYVGDRKGLFRSTPARQAYPSYVKTDLHAGLMYEAWKADVFINNITDKRGLLSGGIGASPSFGFTYIEPRTIGLSLSRAF